jgi:PAS domain S-box-containing protein
MMNRNLTITEQLFKLTFNQSPIGAAILGLHDYRFEVVNQALCRITGYSEQELLNLSFPEITHPDDLEKDIEYAEKLFSGEIDGYQMEKRYIRKDRAICWVRLSGRIVRDESGLPLFFLAMVEDITERKQAEKALEESEKKFRLLAETIESVFWMSTPGVNEMIYVNPAYEKIWGRSRESLFQSPQSFLDAVHPDDKEMVTAELSRHAEGRWEREYRIIRPDGSIRWIYDKVFPIFSENVQLSIMTGFATDVTDRKLTEEALRESERELRLLSVRLITAQERERAAVVSELHNSISQTLMSIKLKIEHTLGLKKEDRIDRAFQTIEQTIPLLQKATQEIRDIYMGLRPPILDDFGIGAALKWLCREFNAIHQQIKFELNAELDEQEIRSDLKLAVFRIAQQALENIVEHSDASNVKISLLLENGKLELCIRDDGAGFDPKESSISHETHKGAGLVSMKERAEISGGSFRLRSAEGEGTTIQVEWPA